MLGIFVALQAFQQISIDMAVWQMLNVPQRGIRVDQCRILEQPLQVIVPADVVLAVDQESQTLFEGQLLEAFRLLQLDFKGFGHCR